MKSEIKIPTKCPSCNSQLETVNSQLFCRNTSCPAQSFKKLEAFAKKMRIKGAGPSTLQKLEFESYYDFYEHNQDYYVECLGEKLGEKLYDEVQRSKNVPFWRWLAALNIPLIGETAAKKVNQTGANSINEIFELLEHSKLPLGPKAEDNFFGFICDNGWVGDFETYFNFEKVIPVETKGSVCITGKLKEFSNRNAAKEILESHGYTVTTSVSGKTNYLVDEEGKPSSKRKKAESLGIPIVSIAQLIEN